LSQLCNAESDYRQDTALLDIADSIGIVVGEDRQSGKDTRSDVVAQKKESFAVAGKLSFLLGVCAFLKAQTYFFLATFFFATFFFATFFTTFFATFFFAAFFAIVCSPPFTTYPR
jgi:hypothetical protein